MACLVIRTLVPDDPSRLWLCLGPNPAVDVSSGRDDDTTTNATAITRQFLFFSPFSVFDSVLLCEQVEAGIQLVLARAPGGQLHKMLTPV